MKKRETLQNLPESAIRTDGEARVVSSYRQTLEQLHTQHRVLERINSQIATLSEKQTPQNGKQIRTLQAKQVEAQIAAYEAALQQTESSDVVQGVLEKVLSQVIDGKKRIFESTENRQILDNPLNDATMKVDTGGRRNENALTPEQLHENIEYAISLGMAQDRIRYGEHYNTSYGYLILTEGESVANFRNMATRRKSIRILFRKRDR